MKNDKLELETAILMLIYRKTGILFVKPGHYLHNMVPRTLRGFGQLLSHLDSMPNIPELDFDKFTSVEAYAEAVLRQSEIAAINQRRFEDYFKYRWINVKITNLEDQDFLRKFAESVSANRIRLAVKYLEKCYAEKDENDKSLGYFNFNDYLIWTKNIQNRDALDYVMWRLDRIHRTERDFLLMFALRTMFTLDSHQHILKKKREAAREYLKNPKDEKILVFDFSRERIRVPRFQPITEDAEYKLAKMWNRIGDNKNNNPWRNDIHLPIFAELLTPLLESNQIRSTIDSMVSRDPEILKLQKVIHKMQEWAIMIYANCEATYEVRKSLYRHIESSESDIAAEIMNSMLRLVSSFNDGNLDRSLVDLEQYGNRYTTVANKLAKLVADALRKTEKPQKPKNKKNKKTIAQTDESTEKVEVENDDADV